MIKLSCGDGNFPVFIDPNAIQTIIDLGPPGTRTEITTSNKALVVNESATKVLSLIRLAQAPFPDKSANDSRVKPLDQINDEVDAESIPDCLKPSFNNIPATPWSVIECDDHYAMIYANGSKALGGISIPTKQAYFIVQAVNQSADITRLAQCIRILSDCNNHWIEQLISGQNRISRIAGMSIGQDIKKLLALILDPHAKPEDKSPGQDWIDDATAKACPTIKDQLRERIKKHTAPATHITCPSCSRTLPFNATGHNFPCERCGILWNTKDKP